MYGNNAEISNETHYSLFSSDTTNKAEADLIQHGYVKTLDDNKLLI